MTLEKKQEEAHMKFKVELANSWVSEGTRRSGYSSRIYCTKAKTKVEATKRSSGHRSRSLAHHLQGTRRKKIARKRKRKCKSSNLSSCIVETEAFVPITINDFASLAMKILLASGDRDIVAHKTLPLRVSETSSSKQSDDEGLISPHESHFQFNFPNSKTKSQPFLPYHASTSKQGENHPTMSKSSSKNKTLSDDHNISSAEFFEVNLVMRMLLQLSWEMVKEITGGFTRMTCFEENENFKTYCRYLNDHQSQVLVRRFIGQLDCVLKAEKKAALSMHHKNILGLSGYYKGKNGTVLIYPFTRRWTLDIFLHVKFVDDLIIGFSIATWLHLKQGLPISSNRFWHTDPSDLESLALLKSDIIHFGILLLRLFCRRSAPRDDKIFVDWARLLLLQRAFHKLLDEDMENLDVYGIFRVMCVAAQCINSKPIS
ncbi:uncharacterized protein LOC114296195 [Camellia sinensis]|uniref:uncharacterized protein LOC114296195 n=1 Tax=Camellia sinensis TaxID=4442 RepID=UPI0010366F8A|nr:uncharacterized protein LOC114296195 [Camellia sinensis]